MLSKANNIISFQLSSLTDASFNDLPQVVIECSQIAMMILERLYVLSEQNFCRCELSHALFYIYILSYISM